MTFKRPTREDARSTLTSLVNKYRAQISGFEKPGYSEAQVRIDFIDDFLIALGWDVRNEQGQPHKYRDVIVEHTLTDAGSTGRPDYRLRVGGYDRIPWEVKKPSINLGRSASSAHQTRSYGFTLQRPAAVLSNFAETVIYDCGVPIDQADGADVAVIPGCRFSYDEYVDRFDQLWDRLSYESLSTNQFYRVYEYTEPPRGQSPFDKSFLHHFRKWRLLLAETIAAENPTLGSAEVGRRTQRLLNALLFLRVCEDRNILPNKTLLESTSADRTAEMFVEVDSEFNAGLFSVLRDTSISTAVLHEIATEMYWPRSKFAYGVIEPDTLSSVYEQHLAERVVMEENRAVELVEKPELVHAGGVAPTPISVVDKLLDLSLSRRLTADGPLPSELTILDPACGSGVFLVRALQRMITELEQRSGNPAGLKARADIVRKHIFGVDIDGEAVEVARLSLLLVVLGDEGAETHTGSTVLPDLSHNIRVGNSLIGSEFDEIFPEVARVPALRAAVSPFDWKSAFPGIVGKSGFSCIVGNPPYIRIQTMKKYQPDHLNYFQNPRANFRSAKESFDVYMLFIEKCLDLLAPDGTMSLIVKTSLLTSLPAASLRKELGQHLVELVNFGSAQIFPSRSTYTCLITVSGAPLTTDVRFMTVDDPKLFLAGHSTGVMTHRNRTELTERPWATSSAEEDILFRTMENSGERHLGDKGCVKIFVGVQSSADETFFLDVVEDNPESPYVTVKAKKGAPWEVERGILRNSIKDRRLEVFGDEPQPDGVVIFPYEIIDPTPENERGKALVLSEEKLESYYPKALEWFRQNEERLKDRHISPDPHGSYWAFGRSQSLTQMGLPKIVCRTLSIHPQYVPDRSGLIVPGGGHGGPYTLLRPQFDSGLTIEVVIALLSHPAVEKYVMTQGKAYRGGYVSHDKRVLANIPVPYFTGRTMAEITKKVQELQSLAVRARTETDTMIAQSIVDRRVWLRESVEEMISDSYGLSSADRESMQG